MTAFAQLGEMDARHRAEVGYSSATKIVGRVADLSAAIRPLSRIKPALRSRYLVKGWLDRGASSVVYGESNVGKTFFALDLALHVAAGEDWRGHRVPDGEKWAGPVLYVAAEGGAGINNRIEAMRREAPDLMAKIEAKDNGAFGLLSEPLDLCTSSDADYLLQAIRDGWDNVALIVVDTLARTMGGGDENTAKDMGVFIRNIDLLRKETGAHVMVIHHSGKDTSKGARGSGSLRAAVDTEIELTRNDGVVMAEARKQRDMPCDGVFAYRLKSVFLGFDEDGDKVTSAVVEATEPVKRKVKLTASAKIALQALDDCIRDHGQKMASDNYPRNRRCVSVDQWRDMCDRHSLSHGEGNSAKRTAFMRAKNTLHEKEMIRIVDGYVWRVGPNDDLQPSPAEPPSQASQTVTSDSGDEGQSSVTHVTHSYRECDAVTVTQTPADFHQQDLSQASQAMPDADEADPDMWR